MKLVRLEYITDRKPMLSKKLIDMKMAGNGRLMTYNNWTDVPATSSLVRLSFLFSAPVDISCAREMLVVQPSIGAE